MVRLQHLLQQAQRSFLAFLGLLFAAVSLELHGELRVGFDVILTVTDGNMAARQRGDRKMPAAARYNPLRSQTKTSVYRLVYCLVAASLSL